MITLWPKGDVIPPAGFKDMGTDHRDTCISMAPTDQNSNSLTTVGRHLECAIQPKLVVELELALIERKQSPRFRHHSIIWQKDTKGFALVGWVTRSKIMQS